MVIYSFLILYFNTAGSIRLKMNPVHALTCCLLKINIDTALKAAHVSLPQPCYFSSLTCECPKRYM